MPPLNKNIFWFSKVTTTLPEKVNIYWIKVFVFISDEDTDINDAGWSDDE